LKAYNLQYLVKVLDFQNCEKKILKIVIFVCNLLMQQKNGYLSGLFCPKSGHDRVFSTADKNITLQEGEKTA
jgi:hypothetical protein